MYWDEELRALKQKQKKEPEQVQKNQKQNFECIQVGQKNLRVAQNTFNLSITIV